MAQTCDGERPLCSSEIQGQVSGGELVGTNEYIVPSAVTCCAEVSDPRVLQLVGSAGTIGKTTN